MSYEIIAVPVCILMSLILLPLARALRLTVPLFYALFGGFLFSNWVDAHPVLSAYVLYALLALSAFSWLVTLYRRIRS